MDVLWLLLVCTVLLIFCQMLLFNIFSVVYCIVPLVDHLNICSILSLVTLLLQIAFCTLLA